VSPTTLGQLPSDQPAPTGQVQRRQGTANTTIDMNNQVTYGTVLQDGSGANMTLSVTPTRRALWLVHAQTMWIQVDPLWMSYEVGLFLSPADRNSWNTFKTQNSQHPAIGWRTVVLDALWSLEANTTYYCSLVWLYSSGYTQRYHTYPYYHFIEAELIEEGNQ
jgi:hypothetical protein